MTHDRIDIPLIIQRCPYCDAPMFAQVTESTLQRGIWVPSAIELECWNEPDVDGYDWDIWFSEHLDLPYVYWLPATQKALRWVRQQPELWEVEG